LKAVVADRYGPPDVLRLAELSKPEVGSGQVLVRVEAASLNTADSDHLWGRPRIARIGTGLRRPATGRVGLDVAGTVEEVGPDVTGLRPGDEVWADLFAHGRGSLAEYVCAPARAFAPKPAGVTFAAAATVPHSGILALQSLRTAGPIRSGDSVLIIGAGGCVGPFAVQIAKAYGAEVTAVDHEGKLDMLRKLGADHVVDYTREDVTMSGRRYDVVLDIADTRSVLRYRRCLQPSGRYVLIARTLSGFVEAAVFGVLITLATSKRMGVFAWKPNGRADLDALARLLDQRQLSPLIDRRFRLEDAADAFRYLQAGHARGKLIFAPSRTSRADA
jgi:NADPH:quinone reductase-like Zn-dependent oxidoreductase